MPTQTEIAAHLDMSQQAVSEMLNKLEIDWQASTIDAVRVRYIRHLRDQAAGRGAGSDQVNLTRQRAEESKAKTALIELQIAEKSRTLVPAADVEKSQLAHITAARAELLLPPDKLVADVKALHGINLDPELVESHVYDALNRLAHTDPNAPADDEPPGDDGLGAAA